MTATAVSNLAVPLLSPPIRIGGRNPDESGCHWRPRLASRPAPCPVSRPRVALAKPEVYPPMAGLCELYPPVAGAKLQRSRLRERSFFAFLFRNGRSVLRSFSERGCIVA